MTAPSPEPLWRIYTTLVKYPILRTRIRARMRQELFKRGIITPQDFEARVREEAILSQQREGVPRYGDPEDVWETRRERIRSYLTDVYFATYLPIELFEQIVREVLAEQHPQAPLDLDITFNPEVAPYSTLVEYASMYAKMPPEEQAKYEAHIQEIKAALIRRIISDQMAYVTIARKWFTLDDLLYIAARKIGPGKIGGKAAGVLLAYRILKTYADEDIREHIRMPESYFIGADVIYDFMIYNNLMKWADQKYKPPAQIREEYPQLRAEFLQGKMPPDIEDALRELLERLGEGPIIVRSSSLLEDNFGTSFAGKYESVFLVNQGPLEKRLRDLVRAIAAVYASALALDPLLYRRERNLLDYDERLAILLQRVEGERFKHYFFPQAAGVAFSRNLFRWSPKIRLEDGFVRMVWGLGTRAVERVGEDYPRLIALSHPTLRPEATAREIRHYSQRFVDVLDLEADTLRTLPIHEVVDRTYPVLRYVFSLDEGGYLMPLHSTFVPKSRIPDLVVTFDEWLRRTPFVSRMQRILKTLEAYYGLPVDIEFTARICNPEDEQPEVEITVLQCRPQSHFQEEVVHIPEYLPEEKVVLDARGVVPYGRVQGIRYVLFVVPEGFRTIALDARHRELVNAINALNAQWEGVPFICVGPGRWGTRNPELGVQVGFADIYNARALVELASRKLGIPAEPSFGTHFFQDLIEAHIYAFAVDLDHPHTRFSHAFFYGTPNRLQQFLPEVTSHLLQALRVIAVDDYAPGHALTLIMDAEAGRAVGLLEPLSQTTNTGPEEPLHAHVYRHGKRSDISY